MTVTFLNSAKIMSLMCAHAAHRGSPSCVCCKVKSNRLHRDQTADRQIVPDRMSRLGKKHMLNKWHHPETFVRRNPFNLVNVFLPQLPPVRPRNSLVSEFHKNFFHPPSSLFWAGILLLGLFYHGSLLLWVTWLLSCWNHHNALGWSSPPQRHGAVPRSLQGAPRILSFTARRHAHSSPRASTEPPANPREKGPPTHHLRAGASWGGTRFTTALHRQEETQICPCSPRRAHDVHTTRNVMMSEDDAVREIKGSRFSISLN